MVAVKSSCTFEEDSDDRKLYWSSDM